MVILISTRILVVNEKKSQKFCLTCIAVKELKKVICAHSMH